MQSNCYLAIDEKTRDCIVLDPGDDGDYIIQIIAREKAKPAFILVTHGHFDHIMAVLDLKLIYKVPFLIHKKDEFLVKSMASSARHFLGIATGP